MEMTEKIKLIETSKTRKPSWFYHAFYYNEENFKDMMTSGIKCRSLLPRKETKRMGYVGHNGYHYISLSKMETCDKRSSSFIKNEDMMAFIIDGVDAKKCKYAFDFGWLERTRWPIRYSGFLDEYQAYRRISPENIVGFRCSILLWYRENFINRLDKLRELIIFMKNNGIDLPIYDYSRASDLGIHQIDTDAYLEAHDDIVEDIIKKVKRL